MKALILLCCSLLLILAGIVEMFFPSFFAIHELLLSRFPDIWQYQYHIGSAEIALGALFIIPAYRLNASLTHKFMETGFRVGFAIMFIGASIFKIHDPKNFALLVTQYQFLPAFSVNMFALLLPVAEFLVGIGLLFNKYTRENSVMLLLMFVAFIIALAYAVFNELGIVCGCFAIDGAQSESEAVISLIRDLVLLPAVFYLCFRPNKYLWQVWGFK